METFVHLAIALIRHFIIPAKLVESDSLHAWNIMHQLRVYVYTGRLNKWPLQIIHNYARSSRPQLSVCTWWAVRDKLMRFLTRTFRFHSWFISLYEMTDRIVRDSFKLYSYLVANECRFYVRNASGQDDTRWCVREWFELLNVKYNHSNFASSLTLINFQSCWIVAEFINFVYCTSHG